MARIEHVFLMRCFAEMKICFLFKCWILVSYHLFETRKMEGTPSSKLRMKFKGNIPKVSCLVKDMTCDQLIVTFSYNKRQLGNGDLGFCLKVLFFLSTILNHQFCSPLGRIPPWKPTCPLKIDGWKMYSLLKWSLFRRHVSFQGCIIGSLHLHTFSRCKSCAPLGQRLGFLRTLDHFWWKLSAGPWPPVMEGKLSPRFQTCHFSWLPFFFGICRAAESRFFLKFPKMHL